MQKEKKRENVYKIIANDDTLHSISEFNNGSHPVTQDPIEVVGLFQNLARCTLTILLIL